MKQLINSISNDLKIEKYVGETEQHFIYRLIYSALGQWCLTIGLNVDEFEKGSSKHGFTNKLSDIFTIFCEMYPFLRIMFTNPNNPDDNWARFIRILYEQTGYFVTNSNNHNFLSNRGRTTKLGDRYLYYGLPVNISCVNGYGVYTNTPFDEQDLNSVLLRETVSTDKYVSLNYESIDFSEMSYDNLQFFNPSLELPPSKSWESHMPEGYSMARDVTNGLYYKLINNDKAIFCQQPININDETLFSYEYRRLYFALKDYYNHPVSAKITRLDEIYYQLDISAFLPNREYYALLLMSWPKNNAFNRRTYIFKHYLKNDIVKLLSNIGVKVGG